MTRTISTAGLVAILAASAIAQTPQTPPNPQTPAQGQGRGRGGPQQPPRDPPPEFFSKNEPKGLVEFELMTWPEVYRAIHTEGKTTALLYFRGFPCRRNRGARKAADRRTSTAATRSWAARS